MNNSKEIIEYYKLVTDEKPDLIDSEPNGWHESRTVSGQELSELVDDKLIEELEEVLSASSKNERIKELAGFLILLEKMRSLHEISEEELAEAINKKVLAGKVYNHNIFLIKATAPFDGKEVNSAKDRYSLTVESLDGSKQNIPIKAVTDRAAIRQAQQFIAENLDHKAISLQKELTLK